MALAYTHRNNSTTASGSTFTTSSFTPNNNCLLVALLAFQHEGSPNPTATTSGLTWTRQTLAGGTAAADQGVAIFTAPVTTGASMTVAYSGFGASWGKTSTVVEFTGYDTGSPVGVTGTNSGGAKSPAALTSVTLSGTSASTSYVIGVCCGDESINHGGFAYGSGWTGIVEQTGLYTDSRSQYRVGAFSTVPWTLGTYYTWAMSAIEIKEAAGAATKGKLKGRVLTRFFNKRF